MYKNLDSLKIPQEIEFLFPNKVRVFEKMKDLEDNINNFMKQKLLTVKEDLLQNNSKVKRYLRIMAEVHHSYQSGSVKQTKEWKLRVEGRLIG